MVEGVPAANARDWKSVELKPFGPTPLLDIYQWHVVVFEWMHILSVVVQIVRPEFTSRYNLTIDGSTNKPLRERATYRSIMVDAHEPQSRLRHNREIVRVLWDHLLVKRSCLDSIRRRWRLRQRIKSRGLVRHGILLVSCGGVNSRGQTAHALPPACS